MPLTAVLFTVSTGRAETVDRIAVSVGTQVITENSVVMDVRVSAFLERVPVIIDATTKRKAADRLVDQVLILREAGESHLVLPTTDHAVAILEQVKAPYGAAYQAEMTRCGVSEGDVIAQLLAGLKESTFTDLRFRPAVQVTESEMREYYDGLKARQPGVDAPDFESSRTQIEALLTGQRVLEALDEWLKTARTAARPNYRERVFQ
ncbi:MAG: hypothetical protein ABI811_14070 [Acidobacteriota bacterium]